MIGHQSDAVHFLHMNYFLTCFRRQNHVRQAPHLAIVYVQFVVLSRAYQFIFNSLASHHRLSFSDGLKANIDFLTN